MSNFTTGPWIYDGVAFIEDKDNNRLAMTYRTQDGCCDGNGRLMAKAPEMYEFIKAVSEAGTTGFESDIEYYQMFETAKQILAEIDNAGNDET